MTVGTSNQALKLLLELGAVTLVITMVGPFEITPLPWLNVLISYFWFAGIVNAVNLLDNMDGVSSGIVIIGLVGLALTGWLGTGELPFGALWALVIAASAAGFWLHNRPPARIFMGDSGSLFLGFVFALLVIPSDLNGFYGLSGQQGEGMMVRFLIGVSLAAIPILDTTLVTVTRLMRGQSPSVGGKDHTTHRLAFSGLTHWQTLWVLYALSATCVGLALFMSRFPDMGLIAFLIALVVLGTVAVYIASMQIQVSPIRKDGWQQLITSFIYRVPLIKMLVDVILVSGSLYAAYLIRFDFVIEDGNPRCGDPFPAGGYCLLPGGKPCFPDL
jgi:UDP-GlcNAc:undecaprenyl-phosphate/decaprenyl-phosphate GlcNAc-1-phosphate transferase